MTSITFSLQEAEARVGQRVKLIGEQKDRFEGETGTVFEHMEYRDGYALGVVWDISRGNGMPRMDYFTRDEFNVLVREV